MRERPHLIPAMIAASLLLVAVAPLQYDFYIILRWVVCIIALHIASIGIYFKGYKINWVIVLFCCVALLFNPVLPIHLTKAIWIPIDLFCSLLFAYVAITVKKPPQEEYGIVEVIGGFIAISVFTVLGAIIPVLIWEGIKALID